MSGIEIRGSTEVLPQRRRLHVLLSNLTSLADTSPVVVLAAFRERTSGVSAEGCSRTSQGLVELPALELDRKALCRELLTAT